MIFKPVNGSSEQNPEKSFLGECQLIPQKSSTITFLTYMSVCGRVHSPLNCFSISIASLINELNKAPLFLL